MKTIHQSLTIFLFTLVCTFTILATTSAASSTTTKAYISFVKAACNSTTYPNLCNKVCLPYASRIKSDYMKMGIYALKRTLEVSKNATKTVSKLSKDKTKLTHPEIVAIKDCVEESKDTQSEIKDALDALIGATKNSSNMDWKVYEIKTWVSAAETNLDTCLNGLDEQNVRPDVKAKISNAIRYVPVMCSNSLSIIGLIQY